MGREPFLACHLQSLLSIRRIFYSFTQSTERDTARGPPAKMKYSNGLCSVKIEPVFDRLTNDCRAHVRARPCLSVHRLKRTWPRRRLWSFDVAYNCCARGLASFQTSRSSNYIVTPASGKSVDPVTLGLHQALYEIRHVIISCRSGRYCVD